MSDPVKNVEIEDVLSSIRRLVSSEERARDDGESQVAAKDGPAEDKLVLTPAQRVDSSPRAAQAAAGEAQLAGPVDDATLEDSLADALGETLDAQELDAAASDLQDDLYGDVEDAEILDEEEEAQALDDSSEDGPGQLDTLESTLEAGADDPVEVPEFIARRRMSREAREDGTGADLSDGIEEAHVEASGAIRRDAEETAPHHREVEGAQETGDSEPEAPAQPEQPEALDMDDLEARIAGVEKAVASQDGAWEPDGSAEDDNAAQAAMSPLPWTEIEDSADEEEPEVTELHPDPAQDDATPQQKWQQDAESGQNDAHGEQNGTAGRARSDWFDEDAVLDEEALRDMVSEIVRQELQGALGERITRNVRKLVRREINRALLGQGID